MDTGINIDMDISESANVLLEGPAKSVDGIGSTIINFYRIPHYIR